MYDNCKDKFGLARYYYRAKDRHTAPCKRLHSFNTVLLNGVPEEFALPLLEND